MTPGGRGTFRFLGPGGNHLEETWNTLHPPHPVPSMPASRRRTRGPCLGLALAALGIVYGDIGTSPLYTLKTVFDPANGLKLEPRAWSALFR